jgi:NAD(P)-dependent dehydrogenase (short-subunit alcohol dehydrogenase family)
MSLSLKGKTALVTGGSRGIGRAVGEKLAADGATVVINYARNRQPAQELVNAIVAKGGKAFVIQADVSKAAEVRRLFNEVEKAVGYLDIVVANAGVHIEKPFIESTEKDYDYVFDINTKGVFFTLKRQPVACATAVVLSLFRRAARSCTLPTTHSISAAKGRSSSLLAPCRWNSARAMSR